MFVRGANANTMIGIVCNVLVQEWCPCMIINLNVQYNGWFLPDILMLTQAPIIVWCDGTIIVYYYYLFNYVLYCPLFLLCLVASYGD